MSVDLDIRGFEQAMRNLNSILESHTLKFAIDVSEAEQSMASLGSSIITGLSAFNTIMGTITHIGNMEKALNNAKIAVLGFINVKTIAATVTGTLTTAIKYLNTVLSANKIGAIIAGISVAVAGIAPAVALFSRRIDEATQSIKKEPKLFSIVCAYSGI